MFKWPSNCKLVYLKCVNTHNGDKLTWFHGWHGYTELIEVFLNHKCVKDDATYLRGAIFTVGSHTFTLFSLTKTSMSVKASSLTFSYYFICIFHP